MKILIQMILVFFVGIVTGQELNIEQLEGSWELKSYVDSQGKEDSWEKYPKNILYQKHIAASHFVWVKYDLDKRELIGMGGGSCFVDDRGRYVEELDFFYPTGSNELGQSIPFKVEFEGQRWKHKGYSKVMEVDLDGRTRFVDSVRIKEIWAPVLSTNEKKSLKGAWELFKYRETNADDYQVYPEMIGYIKLITGSHFVWVKYDKNGDHIYSTGSGRYQYKNGKYTEKIDFHYPDKEWVGKTIRFDCRVEGNLWHHSALVTKSNGEKDLIDEQWTPKLTGDMESAFSEN